MAGVEASAWASMRCMTYANLTASCSLDARSMTKI